VAARGARWHELDTLLAAGRELHRTDGATIARVAGLYRALCNDLMRCHASGYAPELYGYLNGLAARGHNALYGARPLRIPAFVSFLTRDFPCALRRAWKFFLASTLLFCVPLAVGVVGAMSSEDFALQVVPAGALQQMVEAYSEGFGAGRGAGVNTGMAGFYVYNNIGIAFRCFATGILFGAGSIFFLVYNGLVIGTVTGYVTSAGHATNILTFMCGHAPFELTAILISGAAGLKMGHALIETRGLTRVGSLRQSAPDIARMIGGAAVMLAMAAGIEAFWSPSGLPDQVKWLASAIFSSLVAAYLMLAGRGAPGSSA
jgi:uncharacterized membrane protein SpoIIM required for sporulation